MKLLRRNSRLSRRLERRRLQIRAWWKSGELSLIHDPRREIPDGPVVISTLRNEAVRLPWFLDYYRRLGIVHFLMIDNGSTDGSAELLAAQPDVSLWRAQASYRKANFGVDWVNWLATCYAAGRWILCVDPDEFLVYPHCDTRGIPALTRWLEQQGRESFGTLLLDMYGHDSVAETRYRPGQNPLEAAPWYDAQNYGIERHNRYHNLWIQGGPRQRVVFAHNPAQAPALNKIPLVKWRKGFAFVTSTHNLLPQRLNRTYGRAGTVTSGALLHFKFLETLEGKVAEELVRREHYLGGLEYQSYAKAGIGMRLWTERSERYEGWQKLADQALIARGGWL